MRQGALRSTGAAPRALTRHPPARNAAAGPLRRVSVWLPLFLLSPERLVDQEIAVAGGQADIGEGAFVEAGQFVAAARPLAPCPQRMENASGRLVEQIDGGLLRRPPG